MAPGLDIEEIINSLQSPTVQVSNGTLINNSLFNTGISTQLTPTIAMGIVGIRWNIFQFNNTVSQNAENAFFGMISEDVGATDVGAELTDPRTLATAGKQENQLSLTAVGEQLIPQAMLWTAKFWPPLWTVAQRLNILGGIIELGAGTAPTVDIHAKLLYILRPISQEFSTKLVQRLNLATQP